MRTRKVSLLFNIMGVERSYEGGGGGIFVSTCLVNSYCGNQETVGKCHFAFLSFA